MNNKDICLILFASISPLIIFLIILEMEILALASGGVYLTFGIIGCISDLLNIIRQIRDDDKKEK